MTFHCLNRNFLTKGQTNFGNKIPLLLSIQIGWIIVHVIIFVLTKNTYDHGTISILRQQKDWVGRFGKWPFLLTFSTLLLYCTADIAQWKINYYWIEIEKFKQTTSDYLSFLNFQACFNAYFTRKSSYLLPFVSVNPLE